MSKGFEKHFSESAFWRYTKKVVKGASQEVLEKALWLFYALKNPATPLWAKTTITGALGYFIFPIDAIPDAIPIVGFSDDLGVLVAAVGAVSQYVDAGVKKRSKAKLKEWGLA